MFLYRNEAYRELQKSEKVHTLETRYVHIFILETIFFLLSTLDFFCIVDAFTDTNITRRYNTNICAVRRSYSPQVAQQANCLITAAIVPAILER